MTSLVRQEANIPSAMVWSTEQVKLLKDTVCKGATDNEFALFAHVAKKTGLDPFSRQIYAVSRWDSTLKRNSMTFQTGIDGYRLIAERTGKYMPGKEPTFTYNKDRQVESATAYVKKLGPDKQWHEIAATAHYDEYVCTTKEGNPTKMWEKRHIMLGKCAEACALRKAFPSDLSGVYTSEEMQQSDNTTIEEIKPKKSVPTITVEQCQEIVKACFSEQDWIDKLLKHFKIQGLMQLPADKFGVVVKWANTVYGNRKIVEQIPEESKDPVEAETMSSEQFEAAMKGE